MFSLHSAVLASTRLAGTALFLTYLRITSSPSAPSLLPPTLWQLLICNTEKLTPSASRLPTRTPAMPELSEIAKCKVLCNWSHGCTKTPEFFFFFCSASSPQRPGASLVSDLLHLHISERFSFTRTKNTSWLKKEWRSRTFGRYHSINGSC